VYQGRFVLPIPIAWNEDRTRLYFIEAGHLVVFEPDKARSIAVPFTAERYWPKGVVHFRQIHPIRVAVRRIFLGPGEELLYLKSVSSRIQSEQFLCLGPDKDAGEDKVLFRGSRGHLLREIDANPRKRFLVGSLVSAGKAELALFDYAGNIIKSHRFQPTDPYNIRYLNLSKDCRKCYFTATKLGRNIAGLYSLDFDTDTVRRLATSERSPFLISSLSPNDRYLAFTNGMNAAFLFNLATSETCKVLSLDGLSEVEWALLAELGISWCIGRPAWSPDGKIVVFSLDRPEAKVAGPKKLEDFRFRSYTAVVSIPTKEVLLIPARYGACAVR